ncbi:MAG: helix-turn-helix domain-containing protein [Bacteroidetes bacterium]|nr:helix-turn-helix domain-containing protein [Bacteroidota bacterium]
MTDRINKILRFYKINSSKFAEEIGVQKSSISHVLSGRNKPSLDFIQKLLKVYPDINADWLIMGKGKMLIEENDTNLFSGHEKQKEVVPIIKEEKNDSEKILLEPTENKAKTIGKQPITNRIPSNSNKQASKIVIFYSDNTFKEFLPEE